MITIPIKELSVTGNDFLNILCETLFLPLNDKRVVTVMCDYVVDDNVERLRESVICEALYEMVQCFGEDDFIRFVLPTIKEIEDSTVDSMKDYIPLFETEFKKIL